MKKRVILIVWSIILVLLAVSAFSNDWGCCIDQISGCYNVFTQDEVVSCQENNIFEENVSCFEIPSSPSTPVTSNSVCQQIGCCCFDDGTYSGGVLATSCSSVGGTYAVGDDCGAICGGGSEGDVSCNDLNGYWCETPANDAVELTGVTDFTYRPSTNYLCYDRPCSTQDCDYGSYSYEKYCANGINDDQDCLIDNLDTDCQNSIKGYVVDENGKGVSNVKIKIENTENGEIFYTYSVGYDGEYFFQGLSYGNSYRVTVDDSFYSALELPSTFRISPTETFANNKNIVVVPGASRGVEGFVKDMNNTPIEGALVVLDNTDHYAITDSSGNFLIDYVRTGTIYSSVAYKSGYFPSQKTQFRLDEGSDNYFLRLYVKNEGCDISTPIPLMKGGSVVSGSADINIEFEETGCNPEGTIIYRCNKNVFSSCNDVDFIVLDYVEGFTGEYLDEDLEWDTTYVYKVAAYYPNGKVSEGSTSVEVYTGDSDCESRPVGNEFCVYEFDYIDDYKEVTSSIGYKCDTSNQLQVVRTCNEGTKCIEFNADQSITTTACRDIESCEPDSDNLLGLFFDEDSCEGRSNQNFCAYDYSKTNVDYCFSCDSYTSCFDYRSENTCGEDICGIGGCVWEDTDTRLNQGVCYSTDKSSCEDCNQPFNKVFGVCSADVCSNLGDCSFSSINNLCEDCEDISCYEYTSSNFCGTATSIRLNTFDNTITQGSDDSCKQGTCIWNSLAQSCYKDADADGIDDCSDVSAGISSSPIYTENDCMIDTIRPETGISFDRKYFNPETGAPLKITFKATDRVPGKDTIYDIQDIYFCIEGEGTSTCQSTKNNYNTVPLVGINYTLIIDSTRDKFGNGDNQYRIRSGKNTVKYFSKDFSDNMEIVKEDFFYLDTEAPKLDISFVSKSNSATLSTDVFIVGTADEDVFCYAELSDCEVWGNCDMNHFDKVTSEFIALKKNHFGSYFSANLLGLQDGASDVIIKCTDFAGNIFETTESLILDSDSRIIEPTPSGVLDQNNVALSVKTSANVECRYSTDLDSAFTEMNLMSSSLSGSYWLHQKPLTLTEDKNYNYYVRCNYDPIALEKVSFTIDTIKPTVTALDGGMFEITNGWHDDIDLGLVCSDQPEFGFDCNQTMYCLNNLYDFSGEIGTCTPDTVYEGLIDISYPVTVCYYAQENSYNGMGGQFSDTTCQNILVDDTNPLLTVYALPDTVNENSLTIRGSVYDSVEQGTLTFTDVTSDYDSFFDLFSGVKYFGSFSHVDFDSPFDYSMTIDFSNLQGDEEGDIKIWLEEGSDYAALVFDLKDNEVKLGKKGLFGLSTLDKTEVSSSFFTGRKTVRLSQSGNTLFAEVQSLESSDEILSLTGNDDISPNKAGVILKEQSVYDKLKNSFSNIFMLTQTTTTWTTDVYLKINSALKAVEPASGDFTFETKFTEGVPYHGAKYEVLLYAKDLSGRQSDYISKTMTYDLSGPEVVAVTFTTDAEQIDDDYIEYGSQAKIFARIEDDYSQTGSALVEFNGNVVHLDYDYDSGLWEGDIDTENLAIGVYDLKFDLYDKLGNKNVQTLEEGLNIEDRIDPKILITIPNPNSNDPTPTILIETDVLATCEVEYTIEGQTFYISGSGTFMTAHSKDFNNAFPYVVGEETPQDIIVDCVSEEGDRVRKLMEIVMDFRNPIYTIKTQDALSIKSEVQRHSIKYTGLNPMDYGIFFLSDEPVQCKYSLSNQQSGSYSNLVNSFDKTKANIFSSADLSELYYFTDKSTETFTVMCEDRAGNLGVTKTVQINVNSDTAPYMFNLPKKLSNTGELNFNSARSLSCTYSFGGGSGSITRSKVSDYYYKYYVNLPISDKATGSYPASITCSDGSRSTTETLMVHKDSSEPIIERDFPETVTSNSVDLEISLNEIAEIRIYVNGILAAIETADSFSDTIVLDSGYNEVIVEAEDGAGNIAKTTDYIISESSAPEAYISNHIGSSTQDKFVGEVVVGGIATLQVSGNSGQINPTLTLKSSSSGFNHYGFEITRDQLKTLIGDVDYLSETDSVPIIFSVTSGGVVVHSEVLMYHYFSESVIFSSPYNRIVISGDLINQNRLEISGKVNNENYLLSSVYSFGDDFELDKSKFNFTTIVKSEEEIFFEFTNDLGVKTIISSKYILQRAGPSPIISLSPEGTETHTNKPRFLVVFEEVATIIDAKIYNDRLDQIYDVSGFGVIGWRNILNTIGSLPSEGQYYLNVLAEDETGNLGEGQFSFTYSIVQFDIDLISPNNGVSSTDSYIAEFETTLNAICAYSEDSTDFNSMTKMSTSSSKLHTVTLRGDKTINVKCQVDGQTNTRVDTFIFTVDTNPPSINSVEITNAKSIGGTDYITKYPLKADLLVKTNEAAYCRFDFGKSGTTLNTDFNLMSDVGVNQCASLVNGNFCYSTSSNIILSGLEDSKTYSVNIVCQDKAGLNSDLEIIEFKVDKSKDEALLITFPKDYLNDYSVFIQAETKDDVECKFGIDSTTSITNNFPHTDGRIHNATVTLTQSGKHTLYVECVINGNTTQKSKSFVIDKTPPLAGKVLVSNETNSLTFLQAVVQDFRDNESGILRYEYSIGIAPSMRSGWNSIRNWTPVSGSTINVAGLNLVDGQTYYFSVRALNRALLYSDIVSSTGTIVDIASLNPGNITEINGSSDELCSDGVKNGDETGVDCGEACMRPCPEGTFCEFDEDCYSANMACVDFECVYVDNNGDRNVSIDDTIDVDKVDTTTIIEGKTSWWLWLLLILGIFAILGAGGYYAYETYGPIDWSFIKKSSKSKPDNKTQTTTSMSSTPVVPSTTQTVRTAPIVDSAELIRQRKERLKNALRKTLQGEQRESEIAEREKMFEKFSSSDKELNKKVSALKNSMKTRSHDELKELHKDVIGSSDTKKMLKEAKK